MIITVANGKGGSAKTTTAANLATLLGQRGDPTLAIDFDPRFSLTRHLGIRASELPRTVTDVIANGRGVGEVAIHDVLPFLSLVPARRELDAVETALVAEVGRERTLRNALRGQIGEYRDVVIDTPANLGLLSVNALVAADVVVVPINVQDEGAAQGFVELRATLTRLARALEWAATPPLVVVFCRHDPRRRVSRDIREAIARYDAIISPWPIPERALAHQAAVAGVPVAHQRPGNVIAQAYGALVTTLDACRPAGDAVVIGRSNKHTEVTA